MEVTMRYQLYTRADGRVEVVDTQTLQVRYVGSVYGALNAQAALNAEYQRSFRSR
jgi:hypothetical protein